MHWQLAYRYKLIGGYLDLSCLDNRQTARWNITPMERWLVAAACYWRSKSEITYILGICRHFAVW